MNIVKEISIYCKKNNVDYYDEYNPISIFIREKKDMKAICEIFEKYKLLHIYSGGHRLNFFGACFIIHWVYNNPDLENIYNNYIQKVSNKYAH